MTELSQGLFEYHQRSKHRVNHYAPGPTGLDWANQPNPFREFSCAAQVKLRLAADSLVTRYNGLRQGDLPPACRFDLDHLAVLFELSLGLSPAAADDIYEQLRALHRAGTALLVIEQHTDRALELADHAVVLDRGSVVFTGRPADASSAVQGILGVAAHPESADQVSPT